jgi:hypothetical protein
MRIKNCVLTTGLLTILLPQGISVLGQRRLPERQVTTAPAARVLKRYFQAIGGEHRIELVSSRLVSGVCEMMAVEPKGTFEFYSSRSYKYRYFISIPGIGSEERGFNSIRSWAQARRTNVAPAPRFEPRVLLLRQASEFIKRYEKVNIRGKQKLGDRNSVVIDGTLDNSAHDYLYFDETNGLLLRWTFSAPNPESDSFFDFYFEDYRNAGGILTPFTIKKAAPHGYIIKIDTVQTNVQLDDSIFDKPSALRGFGGPVVKNWAVGNGANQD